jgi:hypothetical protein
LLYGIYQILQNADTDRVKPFVIIFWILSVFFHPGILNQEVQLEEVGITVQLSDSWELQQATVGSPEHRYPASNYIIDVSVEDTANAVFNELWVQRFDYFEKRDLVKWHRGKYSLENLAVEKLGRRIELPVPHPEFEEMAIYEFEEIRGEERLKKTQGWVVFATHGQSAFFIRIGTIKSEYPKSHALIKDILYSIRVNAV